MNTISLTASGPNPVLRTSARIEARRLAAEQIPNKSIDTPQLKRTSKAKEAVKSKAVTQSKKATKSTTAARSNQATKPKKITKQRQPSIRRVQALSSLALKEHTKKTIHEPLPEDLRQWREGSFPRPISEEIPSVEISKMSTHEKGLPDALTNEGIFEEFQGSNINNYLPGPAEPKNLFSIQRALRVGLDSLFNTIVPTEGERDDYFEHCEALTAGNICEADIGARSFEPFFGIPINLPGVHFRACGKKWNNLPKPPIKSHCPRPDYCEGLKRKDLPKWIEKKIGKYAVPIPGLAFPNFIVEHKAEGSMKVAHTQCRLDGAFAAKGYYELYGLYGDPEAVLDRALVGTGEFNAETFTGNIHWVSKGKGGLEYHMRRVVCFFTRGVCVEDYIRARQTARNFRSYFEDLRVEHLKELNNLSPQSHPPDYHILNSSELRKELGDRGLSTAKATKAECILLLQKDDAEKNAQRLDEVIERVSQSRMNSQGSTQLHSFTDVAPSNPSESFQSQKRSAGDMMDIHHSQSELGPKRLRGNGT